MSPDNKLIGKPINRVDGRDKVTGKATYAAEFKPQGLKFAWLIQSTISNGYIDNFDDRDAKAVPGVGGSA